MKKIIYLAFFVFMFTFVATTTQAKEMTFFGCTTKDYTKTCKYGYPQSDVGKTIKYYYKKDWVIKKKSITYFSTSMTSKTIYNYNKKGKLKTNKDGKATRYIYKYNTKLTSSYEFKTYVTYREVKVYNKDGKSKSKDKRYYNENYRYLKKVYIYNSKGQLKSNKYGKATRTLRKYKLNNKNKPVSYYYEKGYYNSKGKYIKYS